MKYLFLHYADIIQKETNELSVIQVCCTNIELKEVTGYLHSFMKRKKIIVLIQLYFQLY